MLEGISYRRHECFIFDAFARACGAAPRMKRAVAWVDVSSSVVLAEADWEPLSGDLRFLISFYL